MVRKEPDQGLVAYVGIAAGGLFVLVTAFVLLVQVVGPIFGLRPGAPDAGIIGSILVWAAMAFGLVPAAAIFKNRNGNGNSPGPTGADRPDERGDDT